MKRYVKYDFGWKMTMLTFIPKCESDIPESLAIKEDTTRNLATIFSNHVTVRFKQGEIVESVAGCWCKECK